MRPDFALHLSVDGIALDKRTSEGWLRLGQVAFTSDTLKADLAELRAQGLAAAEDAFATKVVIPNDQIKFMTLPEDTATAATVGAALEGATPYRIDELRFDWQVSGGTTRIAAVAVETLAEAEAFALEHRFEPIAFCALPDAGWGGTEAFFGAATAAPDADVRRDPVPYLPAASDGGGADQTAQAPDAAPLEADAADAPTEQGDATSDGPITATPPADTPLKPSEPEDGTSQEPALDEAAPPVDPAVDKGSDTTPEDKASPADDPTDVKAAETVEPSEAEAASAPEPALDPQDAEETSEPAIAVVPATPAPPSPTGPRVPATGDDSLPGADDMAASLRPGAADDDVASAAGGFFSSRRGARPAPTSPPIGAPNRGAPAPRKVAAAPSAVLTAPSPTAKPVDPFPLPDGAAKISPAPKASPLATPGKAPAPDPAEDAAPPRKAARLALILTIVLLLLLGAVAAFATVIAPTTFAAWFDRAPKAIPAALPDDPVEQVVTIAPVERLPEVPMPEPAETAEAPVVETTPSPMEPLIPADDPDLARHFAANGIWYRAPEGPGVLTPATVDVEVPLLDRITPQGDAVALPTFAALFTDARPSAQPLPPAPEARFRVDPTGLIIATPEGALAPNGYTVIAGRPSLVPPFRDRSGAANQDAARLIAFRPRTRPEGFADKRERQQFGGYLREELAAFRPQIRPKSAREIEEERLAALPPDETTEAPSSPQAVAASVRPDTRPRGFDKKVAAARAAAAEAAKPVPVAAIAPRTTRPSGPTRTTVARAATTADAINLRKVNLIGVYGKPNARRALVRLSNGRFVRVQVGGRLDGGRVQAISGNALRYTKGGRNIVLQIPTT
ncbi:MAG: hypothetical protein ACU0DW_15200 [Shimia sp.]